MIPVWECPPSQPLFGGLYVHEVSCCELSSMFCPLTMALSLSSCSMAANAQQEPQPPWFLTFVTLPPSLKRQSMISSSSSCSARCLDASWRRNE